MMALMRAFIFGNHNQQTTFSTSKSVKGACLMALMIMLASCGQKGALYLEEGDELITPESNTTISTSQPQDAAFADIDDDSFDDNFDDSYDKTRYLEPQQVPPVTPNDASDY